MIPEKVMTVVLPSNASSQPPCVGPSDSGDLPVRSQEDMNVGWGELPGPEDDESLHRERPPHWDSV
jgi:hypothetical protein